ncbi:MAG: hypothetical protein DMF95_07545 [Acidobacteria bacterium]|nr:MAG: hypothetical protein DMF95_07545 [Acidobacteriota bacterium]
MTRVYRILRKRYAKAPFDGEGAYRYGGRWSSRGIRLAYASEHLSLAMIEYSVHLDRDDPPPDLVVATADVPDDVSRVNVSPGSLTASWRQLVVPSAVAPDESNWLLNPDHRDVARIRIHPPEPFMYDARFFA